MNPRLWSIVAILMIVNSSYNKFYNSTKKKLQKISAEKQSRKIDSSVLRGTATGLPEVALRQWCRTLPPPSATWSFRRQLSRFSALGPEPRGRPVAVGCTGPTPGADFMNLFRT
jgi:hypothetical protein